MNILYEKGGENGMTPRKALSRVSQPMQFLQCHVSLLLLFFCHTTDVLVLCNLFCQGCLQSVNIHDCFLVHGDVIVQLSCHFIKSPLKP